MLQIPPSARKAPRKIYWIIGIGLIAALECSSHGLHGAYGLCRIYRNGSRHCELRPEAIDHGCPAMYADPAQDPRLKQ